MKSSDKPEQRQFQVTVKSGFFNFLHRKGVIQLNTRNSLLNQFSNEGLFVEDLLEFLNFEERTIYEWLAEYSGLPLLDMGIGFLSSKVVDLIPSYERTRLMVLPVYYVNEEITVACAMPLEMRSLIHLKKITNIQHFIQVLVPFTELRDIISQYSGESEKTDTVESMLSKLNESIEIYKVSKVALNEASLPIIPIVNRILEMALELGASDIHFEPRETKFAVRFRVDGVLREMYEIPQVTQDAVLARLKVASNLNIVERYKPQDGRIVIQYGSRTIEFRINFLRTVFGEKACLRILDRGSVTVQLQQLGFDEDTQLDKVRELCLKPNGIILVTGATGSGKSTTLFAILNELNKEDVNIITVEDPVEYQVDRVNQCSLASDRGLDFHTALRAILRQDPDIVMLGEIRDLTSAEIAFRAALTGHLVLATLHTNDSIGAIGRLLDLGLEPSLLALGLVGVISQALVRKVCPYCKETYEPEQGLLHTLGLQGLDEVTFARGTGCEKCGGTGTKGRVGIYEILMITEEMQRLIGKRSPYNDLRDAAILQNWHPLRFSAMRKLLRHQTTFEEIIGVIM